MRCSRVPPSFPLSLHCGPSFDVDTCDISPRLCEVLCKCSFGGGGNRAGALSPLCPSHLESSRAEKAAWCRWHCIAPKSFRENLLLDPPPCKLDMPWDCGGARASAGLWGTAQPSCQLGV